MLVSSLAGKVGMLKNAPLLRRLQRGMVFCGFFCYDDNIEIKRNFL